MADHMWMGRASYQRLWNEMKILNGGKFGCLKASARMLDNEDILRIISIEKYTVCDPLINKD